MSKPYEKVSMKARPIKLTEFIKNPGFFKGAALVFEITEEQMYTVQNFCRAHKGELKNVLLTMRPYDAANWSQKAKGFMFMVRDRICGKDNDYTAENKEQVYAAAMIESGFLDQDGERKSLDDLDRREMWILTETMLRLAVEAGCDISDLESLGNSVHEGVEK